AEDQRPQDLPSHSKCHVQRMRYRSHIPVAIVPSHARFLKENDPTGSTNVIAGSLVPLVVLQSAAFTNNQEQSTDPARDGQPAPSRPTSRNHCPTIAVALVPARCRSGCTLLS